jgi:ubiquinone/menaquinone biosynthesis C-methylase UbiE
MKSVQIIELLASPYKEKIALQNSTSNAESNKGFSMIEDIPIFLAGDTQQNYYEEFYQSQTEPWAYSGRAAEVLRHEYVAEQVRNIYREKGRKLTILDLGCSLGHITEKLHLYGETVVGLDISLTAVAKAKKRCEEVVKGKDNPYQFIVASCLELPFQENTFDVVVASDGIWGWFVEDTEKSKKAVAEIYKVLKTNGVVIHTDYLHPRKFAKFVQLTMSAPFQLIKEEPMYDRLWYRLESWTKSLQSFTWVKKLLANVGFAKKLRTLARLLGRNYSKHISVIAKK